MTSADRGDRSGNAPYGPQTAAVRRFLVKLAALDLPSHDAVVARYAAVSTQTEFVGADLSLGEVIERSGRADARDALAGPLMQLVRERESESASDVDAVPLDPIAEPALAALLALLVRDLLPSERVSVLYAPFADVIPLTSVLD